MSVAAKITAFAAEDSGVVSVDWMVISAACIGLSLATVSVVSGGFDALSDDIAASLAGRPLADRFTATDSALMAHETGFSAGRDGWSGDGTVMTVAGFGDVLVIDPGGTVQTALTLPDGTETAQITFDLIGADFTAMTRSDISVNGIALGAAYMADGVAQFDAAPGAPVMATLRSGGAQIGAGPQPDTTLAIAIEIADPAHTLTLAVGSGADGPMSDAFFAIDNVAVLAT